MSKPELKQTEHRNGRASAISQVRRANSDSRGCEFASFVGSVRRSALGLLLGLAIGIGLVGFPSSAEAQSSLHEITWAHASPATVVRFVVFVSSTSGDQSGARQINVGKPPSSKSDSNGPIFSWTVSVDVNDFVAVAAVDIYGRLSPLSNWQNPPPSTPGQPFLIP